MDKHNGKPPEEWPGYRNIDEQDQAPLMINKMDGEEEIGEPEEDEELDDSGSS